MAALIDEPYVDDVTAGLDDDVNDADFTVPPRPSPKSFRCRECNKVFKRSSQLKQHMKTHSGERPFKCFQCDKYFVSAGVLRAHQKTHTGQFLGFLTRSSYAIILPLTGCLLESCYNVCF